MNCSVCVVEAVSVLCRRNASGLFRPSSMETLTCDFLEVCKRHRLAIYLVSRSDEVQEKKDGNTMEMRGSTQSERARKHQLQQWRGVIECISDLLVAILSDLEEDRCVEDEEVSGRGEGSICLRWIRSDRDFCRRRAFAGRQAEQRRRGGGQRGGLIQSNGRGAAHSTHAMEGGKLRYLGHLVTVVRYLTSPVGQLPGFGHRAVPGLWVWFPNIDGGVLTSVTCWATASSVSMRLCKFDMADTGIGGGVISMSRDRCS